MKLLTGRKNFVLHFCVLAAIGAFTARAQDASNPWPKDPYYANNRKPDDRFKADLLVVVAHPDDEIMAAAYIAKAIEEGKRVALVWTVRGNGGTNDVGPEQSDAMGDIRDVEGMRAAASLGITNMWNLGGTDTPTQNPLESLETCSHGRCLDRMVRIVRLTRPAAILTWLPLGVTGENHGDHQAAGIMATEAFDLAGDPTAFPEQVAPAREPAQNMNRTEGLRPWQPQKVYYFSNPTHMDFFAGQGPEYPTTDISPSRHISYRQIAEAEFAFHRTQGGGVMEDPIPLATPSQFILGKSLVKCGVTEDIFAGLIPEGIPYQRAPGFTAGIDSAPVLKIGGPWSFYRQFWQAHGLEHLGRLIPDEVSIQVGGVLSFPLIVENPSDQVIKVSFQVQAPEGWTVTPVPDASIDAHSSYYLRLVAKAPSSKLPGWQQFKVSAESDGRNLGSVSLRIELADWALPQ
jgi:LmbE family N-acetylglucosaminyl deacetylase